jgi:uncharacterized DUF497 family protein
VELRFSWDPHKARANLRKHGVSFEEAETVFLDEHALLIEDPDPASGEDRSLLLGMSTVARVLVVCHCVRDRVDAMRIISARRADKQEQAQYWERLKR